MKCYMSWDLYLIQLERKKEETDWINCYWGWVIGLFIKVFLTQLKFSMMKI